MKISKKVRQSEKTEDAINEFGDEQKRISQTTHNLQPKLKWR